MTTPSLRIKEKKYRYADTGELVMVFGNPFPVMQFVQCEFDKRQYWLEFTDGINSYYTSINLTKWDKFNFETKADITEIALKKLTQARTTRV